MIDEREIRSVCRRIVRNFKPDKVILFGSYAYGSQTEDSDIDLLVILPFEGKSFRKSVEILNRVNPPFAIDLIVRQPDDVERRYRQGDPLVGEALDRGKVLYERSNTRVD